MHWRESAIWQSQFPPLRTLPRPSQRRRVVRDAAQWRGLPSYTGNHYPSGATRFGDGRSYDKGARVQGSGTLRLSRWQGGGVSTTLSRVIPHIEYLTSTELGQLRKLMRAVQGSAERFSQGNMPDSVRRTRPYAQGTRRAVGRLRGSGRGVSNMAIVNRQSGTFFNSWSSAHTIQGDTVTFNLVNNARRGNFYYSRALAFGTKKMKAHGPFTTAFSIHLAEINSQVQGLRNKARARYNAQQQLLAGGMR